MADQETVIIDIEITSQEAVENVLRAQKAIEDLRKQKEELQEQDGDNARAIEMLNAQIKAETDAMRANQRALVDNIKTEKAQQGSLDQLRSTLKSLTKQYDALSRAERQGAKGDELLKHIQQVTEEVKAAEAETGRFQRNVGNYPTVFNLGSTTLGKFGKMAEALTGGVRGLGAGFSAAAKNVAAFGKQLWALVANPVVAIIAAIVAVVKGLTAAFRKNDDASTNLAKGLAVLRPIVDAVKAAFAALADVIGWVVKAIGDAIMAIGEFGEKLAGTTEEWEQYKQAAREAQELVEAVDQLQEAERKFTVEHAQRERDAAELRTKATESEKYSFEQRKEYLENSIELEKQDLNARMVIAREKLRIAQLEAERDQDTSDKTKDRIAELQAAVVEAETAYYDRTRRATKQVNEFEKQERQQREAAAKAAAERRKQMNAAQLQAERDLQDAVLAAMRDGADKQIAMLRAQTQRTVEDLRKRLATETTLTETAKRAINKRIILLEAQLQVQIADIEKQASREEVERQYQVAEQIYAARLAAAVKGSTEEETLRLERMQATHTAELRELKQRLDDGLLMEDEYRQLRAAKVAQHEKELAAVRKEYADAEIARVRQEWENRINAEVEGSIAAAKVAVEAKQWELDQLQQLEGESLESFNARRLAAQKEYADASKALADAQFEEQRVKAEATANIIGSLSDLMESAAGENKELAAAAKILALGQIAVNQGVAIAEGVKNAMALPFPASLAAVATVISSIVAIMTSAIETVNSAQFATGGYVRGAGTATSDSIPARLSNGESVINARSTGMFYDLLSAINVAGGGVPFDGANGSGHFATGGVVSTESLASGARTEDLVRAVRSAVADVQPVVSVQEITKVAHRVAVKEARSV